MTPITERLAEAYQKLDAINEIIFAAENAAMACDVVQPTIKMLSDSDIKRIFDLSLHAEYEASRTHPAEGGEGRDYVLVPREPTEAMVSAGFDVHPCRTGETKVTDAYKAMLAAAPLPQPVAPERGEAKAVATCRICGKSSPRMTVCDSCDESSGPWGGTAVPRDLPNEPESSIHVEKPEPFTYAVVRKDVSPDFFMSRRAAEDAITTSNNRTAKIVNLYATPQPPQPVAPERGEAKAVACVARGQFGHNLQVLVDIDKLADGTMLYATPQPPPAPTFRDPTIEDLQAARLFIEQYEREHPEADDDELGIAAFNAIGAKVEEK